MKHNLLSVMAASAIIAALFTTAVMAADVALYKSTASADGSVVTRFVTENGYIVYNTGNSGYLQYNEVNRDTGAMPFGTPIIAAKKTISRSITDVIDGTYYFRLTGTGVGQGFITGL